MAAVRDPSASIAILTSLPTGISSKLIVVKIDSRVATDAGDAVKELQDIHKIERIDVVGEILFSPAILMIGPANHLGFRFQEKLARDF
jgi:hypothetical protein